VGEITMLDTAADGVLAVLFSRVMGTARPWLKSRRLYTQ